MAVPGWVFFVAALAATGIAFLVIFVLIPYFSETNFTLNLFSKPAPSPPATPGSTDPGKCKCYSDVWAKSPGSSVAEASYTSTESKDNRTFCGFEKDGYRWGCKASDCDPPCT